MKKKHKKIQLLVSQQSAEYLAELASTLGVSQSVIVDRAIKFIYLSRLESQLFTREISPQPQQTTPQPEPQEKEKPQKKTFLTL